MDYSIATKVYRLYQALVLTRVRFDTGCSRFSAAPAEPFVSSIICISFMPLGKLGYTSNLYVGQRVCDVFGKPDGQCGRDRKVTVRRMKYVLNKLKGPTRLHLE